MLKTTIPSLVFLVATGAVCQDAAADDWCLRFHAQAVKAFRGAQPRASRPGQALPAAGQWRPRVVAGLTLVVPATFKARVFESDAATELTADVRKHHKTPTASLANAYSPMIQVWNKPKEAAKAIAESLPKAVGRATRGLYPSEVKHQLRRAKNGRIELCAVLNHSPGHVTFVGGGHGPMPRELDLIHGVVSGDGAAKGRSVPRVVVYRLPERDVTLWWARMSQNLEPLLNGGGE